MAGTAGDETAEAAVRAAFVQAAKALTAADARSEALAEYQAARIRFGLTRGSRMRPAGRVWRLGVFLLEPDGTARATGRVTRSAPPGHPGHAAASVEARREVRAAAYRARFDPGETINFDAPVIDLDPVALRGADGPLFLVGDRPLVRWSVSAGDDAARHLQPYLDERVDLLVHPPQGAT